MLILSYFFSVFGIISCLESHLWSAVHLFSLVEAGEFYSSYYVFYEISFQPSLIFFSLDDQWSLTYVASLLLWKLVAFINSS